MQVAVVVRKLHPDIDAVASAVLEVTGLSVAARDRLVTAHKKEVMLKYPEFKQAAWTVSVLDVQLLDFS